MGKYTIYLQARYTRHGPVQNSSGVRAFRSNVHNFVGKHLSNRWISCGEVPDNFVALEMPVYKAGEKLWHIRLISAG